LWGGGGGMIDENSIGWEEFSKVQEMYARYEFLNFLKPKRRQEYLADTNNVRYRGLSEEEMEYLNQLAKTMWLTVVTYEED